MLKQVLAATLLMGLAASPAVAGRKPANVSWGKPSISFSQYRQDTLDCGNQAYGLDVGLKPATIEALGAVNAADEFSFFADRQLVARSQQSYFNALASVDPQHAVLRTTTYRSLYTNAARGDVIDQLQAVVDYCLVQRGYHRFRLTSDQQQALRGLRLGTEARARFLFGLGTDPRVLAAQAI